MTCFYVHYFKMLLQLPPSCRVLSQTFQNIIGYSEIKNDSKIAPILTQKHTANLPLRQKPREKLAPIQLGSSSLAKEVTRVHFWRLSGKYRPEGPENTQDYPPKFFFLKYKFIYFNWRPITLQYCIGFAIHQHEFATGVAF